KFRRSIPAQLLRRRFFRRIGCFLEGVVIAQPAHHHRNGDEQYESAHGKEEDAGAVEAEWALFLVRHGGAFKKIKNPGTGPKEYSGSAVLASRIARRGKKCMHR